ncbi:hypothetical protein [Prochlorococcus sp. P1344]|uniref:hypothetical protein n=1 Tax=Prochlorococcus sp. P1344 TaxID=2729591 RepID=UPI00145FC856|nr:hypothetical protein [Prochlorococcus sp. P1344]NMO84514.1 hypothetical protein [Prochlorococcus sp. P1344]
MSQLTIKLSVKADALIAQLQKEIFNRRRKKVSAAGVVETLVESGAKSQSDKRFATSWTNLIKDIEKAAKLANTHGSKPSNLTADEWAMVLTHRSRGPGKSTSKTPAKKVSSGKSAEKSSTTKASTTKAPARKASTTKASAAKAPAKKASAAKAPAKKASAVKAPAKKTSAAKASAKKSSSTSVGTSRPARRARKASGSKSLVASTSVAKRMAKAAGRLGTSVVSSAVGANGSVPLALK